MIGDLAAEVKGRSSPVKRCGSAGVIHRFGLGGNAFAGGIGEIEEGLAGELRDARVGVPQQGDEHADPAQLGSFNSDDGNGFRHGRFLSVDLVGGQHKNLNFSWFRR